MIRWYILGVLIISVRSEVTFTTRWPAGQNSLAGAKGYFTYSGLYTGTCTIILPRPVALFVGENFDIVPQYSDKLRGQYVLTAPYKAYHDSQFNFMIRFHTGLSFTDDGIEWWCDRSRESKLGIGSFPTDLTQTEVFSHIWVPDLRTNSELTIYFPSIVANFKCFGATNVVKRAMNIYKLSGFYLEQNEVWFQFRYMMGRKFDATEVKVIVQYYKY